MVDLEDLLRTEVTRRSDAFEPPADQADRIATRARHLHRRRQRRQRLAGGVLAAGVAAVVVVVLVLLPQRGDDHDSVRTTDDDRRETTTSTTEAGSTTTTTPAATTPSSTTATTSGTAQSPRTTTTAADEEPQAPTGPLIGRDTPLSRSGVGPITAGMTLRQAEAAAGVVITPWPNPGPFCASGRIEGTSVQFLAERSGTPEQDVMDSVIRAVDVSGEGSTEESVAIGDPPSVLTSTYGPPTRTVPAGEGSQYLVFQQGGYAYAFLTNLEEIAVIYSGDPNWVGTGDPNGCAS